MALCMWRASGASFILFVLRTGFLHTPLRLLLSFSFTSILITCAGISLCRGIVLDVCGEI